MQWLYRSLHFQSSFNKMKDNSPRLYRSVTKAFKKQSSLAALRFLFLKEGKVKTYSIENHIYFKIDDPLCWPCQLLVFQDVGFLFTILNLWEERHDSRLSHSLYWIHYPGHLWPPAAETDREPKTTVAILTSTCSLPARSLSGEINYRGIQHGRGPRVLNFIYLFFSSDCVIFLILVENWVTLNRDFFLLMGWEKHWDIWQVNETYRQ